MSRLKDERGFTLAEVLVTMVMMLTVMFALYSIFDMSLRVFSFGNDKVEAVENARLGMERMEREIRAAYPYDKAGGDNRLFPNYSSNPSNEITFGNDSNGNRQVDSEEQVTYELDGTTLDRNGSAAVEFVRPDSGLEFTYLKSNGVDEATSEDEIAIVRIELTIDKDDRVQTLTTDVTLRNWSGQ